MALPSDYCFRPSIPLFCISMGVLGVQGSSREGNGIQRLLRTLLLGDRTQKVTA